jgi:hypothetical protein
MITWVAAKFERWGQWVQMDRGMGSKGLSASWGSVGGGAKSSSFVPITDLECSRLDDWVKSLTPKEQAVLLQVYCTSKTSREHARVLNMSLRTLYAHLHTIQVSYTRRFLSGHGKK